MSYWALRIGLALVAIGLILLSPVGDLLPVDFWFRLKNIFSDSSSSSEHMVFRFVPGESSRTLEFVLIGVGLVLVAFALYFGAKE
jgi:hypothetical protein